MAERLSTGLRNELMKAGGKSFADCLANGIIRIYTGTQPTTADDAEGSVTLLNEITLASGAFVSESPTNGINLDVATAGAVAKSTSETWSGVAVATGTAGWFRFYANTVVTGASTTGIRFDGNISTSGAEINMSNLSLVIGGTTTIDAFIVTMPAA